MTDTNAHDAHDVVSAADDARVSIELDTVVALPDRDGSEFVPSWESWTTDLAKLHVTAEITNPSGPAGGWPVIRYEGEKHSIVAMLTQCFGFGSNRNESVEWVLEQATLLSA